MRAILWMNKITIQILYQIQIVKKISLKKWTDYGMMKKKSLSMLMMKIANIRDQIKYRLMIRVKE